MAAFNQINNEGINVLLINPSPTPYDELNGILGKTNETRVPSCGMPVGLMDIAAYVRKNSHVGIVKIIDFGMLVADFYMDKDAEKTCLDDFIDQHICSVDFVPDIVGISSMFNCVRKATLDISFVAKDKWPACITILGGNVATGQYMDLIWSDSVDYIALGEGEKSLSMFINNLHSGVQCPDVQGIISKSNVVSGHGIVNGPAMVDMTELPLPAFDLVDMEFYTGDHFFGRVSVMFSRGCPFPCTFCGSSVIHGRKVRHKSTDQCIAELKYLFDYGCTHIKPEDDIWAINKPRFMKLVDAIVELKKNYDQEIDFELSQGLSVAVMDEERIDAIMRMGCYGAQLAIESGSPYVQKNIIKKNVKLDKARNILDYMRRVGFEASVNFIVGYPGESSSMRQETFDYIKTIDVNWVYIFNCAPIKGTKLFNEFEKVADMDALDWDNMRMGRRLFDTSEISAESLESLIYDANIDVNFFNNINMRKGRFQLAIDVWDKMIIDNYPFHVVGQYCKSIALAMLGDMDRAVAGINKCLELVDENRYSKSLYNRYKLNMPILTELISDKSISVKDLLLSHSRSYGCDFNVISDSKLAI